MGLYGKCYVLQEIGLITGEKRSATIICKTDIEVLVIDKEVCL